MPYDDPEDNHDEGMTELPPTGPLNNSLPIDAQQTSSDQDDAAGQTIGQRIMQLGRQPAPRFTATEGMPWRPGPGSAEQFFGGMPRFTPKTVAGETNADATAGTTKSPFTVDRQTLPTFHAKFGQSNTEAQPDQANNPIPKRQSPADFDDLRTLTEESSRPPRQGVAASVRPRQLGGEMSGMAKVTVPRARDGNVRQYFPPIIDALRSQGFSDLGYPDLLAYSLATINSESGGFEPISESANHFNTTAGGHPFDIYEDRAHRRSLGNTEPGDGERFRGRGFIQLTGRANYAAMGKKLGVDLEGDPDLANDPQIASRIFAQYMKDHEFRQGARAGLSETLGNNVDAQDALRLYIDGLRDVHNEHPEIQTQLANHNLVRARTAVNGANRNGLPNGLENFLPAFHFGKQYLKLMRTSAQNPDLTVNGAADIWTEGDPLGYRDSYISNLKKQLGTDLDTKVSALNAQQRQTLERAQENYVRRVEQEIQGLLRQKRDAN